MAYEFGINQVYCVDPAWFYCMATGRGKLDADFFQQEVVNTGISDEETAISHLVNPLLSRIGFPADTFSITVLDPTVIEYSGFPLKHGLFYIFFNDDAIRSIVEGYPDQTWTVASTDCSIWKKRFGVGSITPNSAAGRRSR